MGYTSPPFESEKACDCTDSVQQKRCSVSSMPSFEKDRQLLSCSPRALSHSGRSLITLRLPCSEKAQVSHMESWYGGGRGEKETERQRDDTRYFGHSSFHKTPDIMEQRQMVPDVS